MLREVPKGTTRLAIRFGIPAFFSIQSKVMGSVAEEELVEKAVMTASDMAWRNRKGLTFPMNLMSKKRPTNMKTASPVRTESMKKPNPEKPLAVFAKAFATRQKTPRG